MEPATPNGAAQTQAPAAELAMAVREQDRLMPIANVIRIMRRVLPPHAKISDDAKELIQECVSEFISFVTGEANDRCHGEHRKTVTADDVVWAMERLGFDDYATPLAVYLRRMRESEGGGRGGAGADLGAAPRASPAAAPPPVAALHRVQMQQDQTMYAPIPAPAYTVAMPGATAINSLHLNGPYEVFGGDRSMAAYYGGAYGAGTSQGSHEVHDDEASSSNATPAPSLALGDGSLQ